MFEPKTYHEKRGLMNEILLQQLASVVSHMASSFSTLPSMIRETGGKSTASQVLADNLTRQSQNLNVQIRMMLEQYGRGQQLLRDGEVGRILGPVVLQDGVKYATPQFMLDFLMANVGRTYFKVQEHTEAPDGCIGTSGFHSKFPDWLNSLPAYDVSVSRDMVTGFYRDEMTNGATHPLPILVLRNGSEIITILYKEYVSVMALNLDMVPSDYRWENPHHYTLRGEMYTYRGNMSEIDFEASLAAALADQGVNALYEPKRIREERLVESSETPTLGHEHSIDEVLTYNTTLTFGTAEFTKCFDAFLETASDSAISENEKSASAAMLEHVISAALVDEPSEEIFDALVKLNRARFGEMEFLPYSEWMRIHFEEFKKEFREAKLECGLSTMVSMCDRMAEVKNNVLREEQQVQQSSETTTVLASPPAG